MYTRLSKVVMLLAFALYTGLVAIGNLTDYGSNFSLVEHVLRMDTTFPDNRVMWRAIESSLLHHVVYGFIIFIEIVIALLCCMGGLRLLQNLNDPLAFNQSKSYGILGLILGFILWFTGFMTIGGEWFLMWQSNVANSQEAAFRLVVIISLMMIHLTQMDAEKQS
jgi:predicted small integral membrane protein